MWMGSLQGPAHRVRGVRGDSGSGSVRQVWPYVPASPCTRTHIHTRARTHKNTQHLYLQALKLIGLTTPYRPGRASPEVVSHAALGIASSGSPTRATTHGHLPQGLKQTPPASSVSHPRLPSSPLLVPLNTQRTPGHVETVHRDIAKVAYIWVLKRRRVVAARVVHYVNLHARSKAGQTQQSTKTCTRMVGQ